MMVVLNHHQHNHDDNEGGVMVMKLVLLVSVISADFLEIPGAVRSREEVSKKESNLSEDSQGQCRPLAVPTLLSLKHHCHPPAANSNHR